MTTDKPENKFARLEAQLTAVKAIAEVLLLVESPNERRSNLEAAAALTIHDTELESEPLAI